VIRALAALAGGGVCGIALTALLAWMFLSGCPLVDRDWNQEF
jgi:hypothetical protein